MRLALLRDTMGKTRSGFGNGGEAPLERRLAWLIADAEDLSDGKEQRREALIERAEREGLDRPTAEQAYDISVEEKLPPAYGLALVRLGISVALLDGGSPDVEVSEPSEPEWIDEPPGPREATRERRLRETFRRLRSHLDETPDARQATSEFAREPDLEAHDYD